MKKAMIAMSGGVDSSVAAWLMKRDGYDCMGVTMRLFAGEDSCERKGHTCCSLDDVEDARSVARQLGIPYFVFNFTEDFGTQIMDRFVCAYENGFTPNPCIDCNRYMKFEKLMKRAKELDYDYVVTGHYARIEEQDVDIQTGLFVPSFFLGVPHGECFIGIHPRRADLGERGGGSGVAQGEGQQNGGKAGEELVQAHSGLLMRGYASCWRRGRPETRA